MDWKDIAGVVGNVAPMLGGLLGGPAGAAVGGIISSALGTSNDASAVQQAIATNPDAAVKLRQIESEQAIKLRELMVTSENNRLIAQTASVAAVNTTMQEEAKSDHFPTYTWRPFIGFCFGILALILGVTICICYISVMFFSGKAEVLAYIPPMTGAIAGVMAVMSPILGIASWFRGKMQADPNVKSDNRG